MHELLIPQTNRPQFIPGNEAIVRGAIESGVGFVASYPNVIMIGVLVGTGILPVSKTSFQQALRVIMHERLTEQNLRALDAGFRFGAQIIFSLSGTHT